LPPAMSPEVNSAGQYYDRKERLAEVV